MKAEANHNPLAWAVTAVIVLLLYMLSVGPVLIHYHRLSMEPPMWVQTFYTPAQWASAHCRPLSDLYQMWFEWLEQFV